MWRNGEPGALDMEIDISAQVVTYIDSLIGTEDLSNGEMGAIPVRNLSFMSVRAFQTACFEIYSNFPERQNPFNDHKGTARARPCIYL